MRCNRFAAAWRTILSKPFLSASFIGFAFRFVFQSVSAEQASKAAGQEQQQWLQGRPGAFVVVADVERLRDKKQAVDERHCGYNKGKRQRARHHKN